MCKRSILGIDLMRVANSSLLSYGPKSENNLSCLASCSGKDRSLIEYLHRDAMRGNIPYDIFGFRQVNVFHVGASKCQGVHMFVFYVFVVFRLAASSWRRPVLAALLLVHAA